MWSPQSYTTGEFISYSFPLSQSHSQTDSKTQGTSRSTAAVRSYHPSLFSSISQINGPKLLSSNQSNGPKQISPFLPSPNPLLIPSPPNTIPSLPSIPGSALRERPDQVPRIFQNPHHTSNQRRRCNPITVPKIHSSISSRGWRCSIHQRL